MNTLQTKLATTSLLLAAALPAWATSSAASSASDSITTSVGSVSGSLQTSSNGSSKTTGVAEGDYKITDVAVAEGRPGTVRVKLQALADAGADAELLLYLPQETAARAGLAPGGTVAARQRPYGVEFAQGQPRQAFFLVLKDEWYRELQTTAVVL
jgi:hypothetical protein